MKTLQFTEAKARLSEVLDEVERGEVIDITRHGKTVARIIRPEDDDRMRKLEAVRKLQEWRKTLPRTSITIEDILSARDEGRK